MIIPEGNLLLNEGFASPVTLSERTARQTAGQKSTSHTAYVISMGNRIVISRRLQITKEAARASCETEQRQRPPSGPHDSGNSWAPHTEAYGPTWRHIDHTDTYAPTWYAFLPRTNALNPIYIFFSLVHNRLS